MNPDPRFDLISQASRSIMRDYNNTNASLIDMQETFINLIGALTGPILAGNAKMPPAQGKEINNLLAQALYIAAKAC